MIDNTALVALKDAINDALIDFISNVDSTMIVESPHRDVIVDYTFTIYAPMSFDDISESVNLYKELALAKGLYVDFYHNRFTGWILIALDGDYSEYPLSPWHM